MLIGTGCTRSARRARPRLASALGSIRANAGPGQASDRPAALDPATLDAVLQYGLMVIDAIDDDLARGQR
jgi:hypothetical protein